MVPARRMWSLLSVMLLVLLGACGYDGVSGSVPPTKPSSKTSPVVLQVGFGQYQPGETVRVTIRNQSQQTISFPDHLTECSVLLFEYQAGSAWKPVAPCKRMIRTRILFLKAGMALDVTLTPSFGWLSGMYRATLTYNMLASASNENDNATVGSGPEITISSSTFHITVGDQNQ